VAGPLVTAAEFCEWTGLREPPDLSRIQALIDSASAAIRGFTGQVLSQVVNEQITVLPEFDRTTGLRNPPPRAFGHIIYLPERPVTAVSITVNAVAFTSFAFNEDGVIQRTDNHNWEDAAVVTYTHGYAEMSDEYRLIRKVCIEATKRAYTADESGQALSQGGFPVETVGFPTAVFLTQSDEAALGGLGMIGVG
jgi:hypothetical protein